jgi:glycerophosphoryl diester phosphodiesterase
MTQAPTERLSLRRRLELERGRLWVVGHRGAMGYCPENTLASFERGLELGADWIEMDVHLSKDGELVVIHDETLDRTTNGHGYVKDHTLVELKQLDAGGGEHIPALDDVLAWARTKQAILDIEIKNAPLYYDGIERKVVSALDQHRMTEQVVVISFDHHAVKRIKQLDDRILTGVLYGARPVDAVAMAKQAQADGLLPQYAYVTREDVDAAHAAGLFVAPWTVNDAEDIKDLATKGVDAIATNYPDRVRGVKQ